MYNQVIMNKDNVVIHYAGLVKNTKLEIKITIFLLNPEYRV